VRPGAGAGTFDIFVTPVLNDTGQTAFLAGITGGSSTQGIYRSSSGSTPTAIALQGQSAPGAGAGTFSAFASSPVLNDTGQTAFVASITGGSSTEGIYRRSSGSTLTAIALQGQSAPGAGAGTFSFFDFNLALNDTGQTAFFANITGGSSNEGLYRSSSGSALTAIALQGQNAPGAGAGTFSSFTSAPVLNDAGQTAFVANITGGSSTSGLYRSSSGSALTAIALQGQSAPRAGAGTFFSFDTPVLNDTGQTAFAANITGGSSTSGIYRSSSGSALTAIALEGQSAPGAGGGTFSFFFFDTLVLNDTGQTAFLAFITGGSSTLFGIYRSSSGSALTAIALQGQSAPGAGAGTFSNLGSPVLNDSGQTAFVANITGGSSTDGLFIGDGREIVAAQLQGNALAGRTVSFLSHGSDPLNRYGQLAYEADFTDGSSGIFVFTPALRWRESFSSSWDVADRWTLGIAPASVHDVTIDPSATLTVTGPTGAASVRSLTVGSGSGFATLAFSGGTLDSASAVQIAGRGILAGNGTITAQVVNAGEVRADNLILSGGLVNNGTVRGATSGNQRIDANLTNNASGLVRADAGERLVLVGTSHGNSGSVEVRNGELQVIGTFSNAATGQVTVAGGLGRFNGAVTNAAGGRINVDDGTVLFNGGLTNNGQVLVTFGESSVFGAVTTNAGGRIILSGNSSTTFYDAVDVKSGGELRISTGSTAVFFGQVFQRTGSLFTGAGTKFYEGGLSVGGSPGSASDAGDVSFGAGNPYLAEIGGTAPGSEHDFYSVLGHLSFGGVLELKSWEGYVAQASDRFDLFDWGTHDGQFSRIDADAFLLAQGTYLDTSRLYVDGSIEVAAIPEPGTWALMLAGLAGIGATARRRNGRGH
jgi:hypothetical protein